MGIYDRDYYRKSGPSISDAWSMSGRACRWIVLANVVLFVAQLVTRQGPGLGPVTEWLAMKPQEAFFGFQIWRFVTGAFLHDPTMLTHLFFNMLVLWFLGPDVEDLYGSREFLAFFLLAGTIGNVCWGLATLWRAQPGGILPLALGASGAVLGVMILAAFHYPNRTIYLMWFIPVPLWALAALTVVTDLYSFLGPHRAEGAFRPEVAVAAHLGGAAFGFLYYQLNWRILRGWQSLNQVLKKSARPKLRVYREEEAVTSSVSRSAPDEQLEAKADEVLAKVGQHGMGSLTAEEREILQKASEAYRKRRG